MVTIIKRLLAGIAVVSIAGVVLWWLQSPSTPETAAALRAPTKVVAGSVPGNPLSDRVAMIEALLTEEAFARRSLEQRLQELEARLSTTGTNIKLVQALENRPTDTLQEHPAESPKNLGDALTRLGVARDTAEQIRRRVGENQMAILSLRDQAMRESWIDSPEYVAELDALSGSTMKLRAEFGDQIYDRYLYASGKPNRVLITDIYPNSAAVEAGIQHGDVVLRYASEYILSMNDLRQATVGGIAGKSVLVVLQRDGVSMYVTVPRGPLGLQMEAIRQVPGDAY